MGGGKKEGGDQHLQLTIKFDISVDADKADVILLRDRVVFWMMSNLFDFVILVR